MEERVFNKLRRSADWAGGFHRPLERHLSPPSICDAGVFSGDARPKEEADSIQTNAVLVTTQLYDEGLCDHYARAPLYFRLISRETRLRLRIAPRSHAWRLSAVTGDCMPMAVARQDNAGLPHGFPCTEPTALLCSLPAQLAGSKSTWAVNSF